jgi:hypothetical protein
MVAVGRYVAAMRPAGESAQTGINTYTQHLWQTGDVRVFLPASLGW